MEVFRTPMHGRGSAVVLHRDYEEASKRLRPRKGEGLNRRFNEKTRAYEWRIIGRRTRPPLRALPSAKIRRSTSRSTARSVPVVTPQELASLRAKAALRTRPRSLEAALERQAQRIRDDRRLALSQIRL